MVSIETLKIWEHISTCFILWKRNAIFDRHSLVPELISSDFERAFLVPVKKELPGSLSLGSYFHHIQVFFQKNQRIPSIHSVFKKRRVKSYSKIACDYLLIGLIRVNLNGLKNDRYNITFWSISWVARTFRLFWKNLAIWTITSQHWHMYNRLAPKEQQAYEEDEIVV